MELRELHNLDEADCPERAMNGLELTIYDYYWGEHSEEDFGIALYTGNHSEVIGFVLLRRKVREDLRGLDQVMTAADFFNIPPVLWAPLPTLRHLGLVFLTGDTDRKWLAEQALEFAGSVRKAMKLRETPINRRSGLILWMQRFGGFDIDKTSHLRMKGRGVGWNGWSLDEGSPSVLLADDRDPLLLAVAQKGSFRIAVDASSESIVIAADEAPLSIALRGSEGKPEPILTTGGIELLTSKPQGERDPTKPGMPATVGKMAIAQSTTLPAFAKLRLGMTYSLVPMPGLGPSQSMMPSSLFYPLMDPSEPFPPMKVGVVIAPNTLAETTITFNDHAHFASGYRTPYGETVYFSSIGARIEAARSADGRLNFGALGTFIPFNKDGKSVDTIACGLGGSETVKHTLAYAGKSMTFDMTNATVWMKKAGDKTTYMAATADSHKTPGLTGGSFDAMSRSIHIGLFKSSIGKPFEPVSLGDVSLGDRIDRMAVPYGALRAGPDVTAQHYVNFETGYLAPRRQAILEASPLKVIGTRVAVTPQGFAFSFDGIGNLSSVSLARIGRAEFAFTSHSAAKLAIAFNAAQPLVVATCPQQAGGPESEGWTMDGWAFDLGLPSGKFPGQRYTSVVIVKACQGALATLVGTPAAWTCYQDFNDCRFDPKGQALASYLIDYFAEARRLYADGDGIVDFRGFVELIDDPNWTGVLVVSPRLDIAKCDAALEPLLVGVDAGHEVYGHHLAVASNNTRIDGQGRIEQTSSVFGVIRYVRPGTLPEDKTRGRAAFVASGKAYDFQVPLLHATFVNSRMSNFESAAQLIVGELFGEIVLTSPAGALEPGTNVIPLIGSAHRQADSDGYSYSLAVPTGYRGIFYLSSSALNQVTLDKVAAGLHATGQGKAMKQQIVFDLAGWLGTREGARLDLLSYSTLAFSGVSLAMTYEIDHDPVPPTFDYRDGAILLQALHEEPGPADARNLTQKPGFNWYRAESLVGQLPLALAQLKIVRDGTTPGDLGYVPMEYEKMPRLDFTKPWYGLELGLDLGTNGGPGARGLLAAQLLIAWAPGGNGRAEPSVATFFRIEGPDGMSLELEIEGVVKIGAKRVSLTRTATNYVIALESIGVHVLSLDFPSGGAVNFYLAGFKAPDQKRALGWFGGYAENQKKAIAS